MQIRGIEIMATIRPLGINSRNSSQVAIDAKAVPSEEMSWSMIQVSHYQFSAACETPEHRFSQHFILVHLNDADVAKEQILNGQLQRSHFRAGDICLTPAIAPVSVRLQAPCELVGLHIEPSLFAQLAVEIAGSNSIELVPQFKLNDPLIYQMAIALKAQLKSSGEWNRLYIESMATALSVHLLQHYSTQKPQLKTHSTGLSNGLSEARLKEVVE